MNDHKETVFFVNPSWENHSLISFIGNAGFNIIGFGESLDPKNAALPFYRHIKGRITDYASMYDICRLYNVTSVASDNCDYSLLVSERLSCLLDLPTLGVASAEISNNKLAQRNLANKSRINQPKYSSCTTVLDVLTFVSEHQCDFLLKPLDSRGSMGISCLTKTSSACDIAKAISVCLSASPSGKFLAEEFISGELYTIDGYIADDKLFLVGVASRKRSGLGNTVTRQILYDSSIDSSFLKKSFDFLTGVKNAFNYSNGHIHCEALLNSSGDFYLVECTNRGGGVFTSSVINPYVCGVDLNHEYMASKFKPGIISKLDSSSRIIANLNDASLLFPSLGEEGQILQAFDAEAISTVESVLEVQLFAKIGRPLVASFDGPSRHYAVALKTSDTNQINSIVDHIHSNFISLS